ncbi:MAG: tetratricopeptide repeat protein [Myxococcaceae bacterium]|nr:tetratricopeptide repeat protein [Myxococcaceae bacterium]
MLDAPPFALDAATLSQAAGGVVPSAFEQEMLLFENSIKVNAEGKAVDTTRSVWRILNDQPNQTYTTGWSPWREGKPRIKCRVISAEGHESWVDASHIVEGTDSPSGIELNDAKLFKVVLPNAKLGSVVELVVTRDDVRPVVAGAGLAGSWNLWSNQPLRRLRMTVEVPESSPLHLEGVGIAQPTVEKRNGMQVLKLDLPELKFNPRPLTLPEFRAQAPRLDWSTAPSWEFLARQYGPLVDKVLSDKPDFSALSPAMAQAKTLEDKVQAVVRWLSDKTRYTAVHLGDGAIVPTSPSTVLARGYGDCKDLSVVTVQALRHFGIPAYPALVNGSGLLPVDAVPSMAAFDHMIVAIPREKGGNILWVDPTAPKYPIGVLPKTLRDQRALIVRGESKGLTALSTRLQTPSLRKETITVHAASFSSGAADITLEVGGAGEGALRSSMEKCDEHAARELLEETAKFFVGDEPFQAKISGCKVGDGTLSAQTHLAKAPRVDTGDRDLSLQLPSQIVTWVIPNEVIGDKPSSDQRQDAQKKDDAQRLADQYGMTEDEVKNTAFSFASMLTAERVYKIALPPRFAMATLPNERTVRMGPAVWNEQFTQPTPETLEVRFRFENKQVDWSVSDIKAFRAAFWKRFDEPPPTLTATFAPLKLLEEKKPQEAVALVRRWLKERPDDGPTRARFARVLNGLGLSDLAREEVERALVSNPEDPLVLMVCGDVLRYDAFGVRYENTFARDKVLACLRKALQKEPDHSWAQNQLADVLLRNENGELEHAWTKDVAEAVGFLTEHVNKNDATREMASNLTLTLINTERHEELKQLLLSHPELRNETNGEVASAVEVLTTGVDGLLERLSHVYQPQERFKSLMMGFGVLTYLRRYDDVKRLLNNVADDPSYTQELKQLRAFQQQLRRAPKTADLSNPEAATRTVFATIANASTATDAGRKLKAFASANANAELDGTSLVFRFVRWPNTEQAFQYDALYSRGACKSDGNKTLTRVRCAIPEDAKMSGTAYWVREGSKWKLESLGKVSQLAQNARRHWAEKHAEEAALWVSWVLDDLAARKADWGSVSLLRQFWDSADHRDLEAIGFASALANLVFTDQVKEAPLEVVQALDRGRSALKGSLKRSADSVVARVYEMRRDYSAAIAVLEPLAQSENEPMLWRWLTQMQSHQGQTQEAMARIESSLKKDATNADWRALKGSVNLHARKYTEALDTLESLHKEKGETTDVRNNLYWARLMAGRLDEDTERDVKKMASGEDTDEASLHTAAMVLMERGQLLEAAQLAARRFDQLRWKPDDPQWLFRGRLLQAFGFDEASRVAFSKMKTNDPELNDLRDRSLATLTTAEPVAPGGPARAVKGKQRAKAKGKP